MRKKFQARSLAYTQIFSMLVCCRYIVCIYSAIHASNRRNCFELPLSCGVPQGSVGGPTLFSIYLIGLRQILLRHGIRYHIYADDIQLMVSFKSNQIDAQSAVHRLEACINDIQAWIHSHSLKLMILQSANSLFLAQKLSSVK